MTEVTGLSETDASNTTITGVSLAEGCDMKNMNDVIRNLSGALARAYNFLVPRYVTTGAANAYVLTPAVALPAYVSGQTYSVRMSFTNSGAATLNISALGAKAIKRYTAAGKIDVIAGDLQNNQPCMFVYDGTDMILMSRSGTEATTGAANIFTATQTVQLTDSGAAGPDIVIDHASASPAANDVIGNLRWTGRDSGAGTDTYATIHAKIADPTAASEDGTLEFDTVVAGSIATRAYIGQGFVVGSPTGGDKGVGTINATAVYDDSTLLTDYVFDIFLDGHANAADRLPEHGFDPMICDPEVYAFYWRQHRRLPGMPSREQWDHGRLSVGDLLSRLWEKIEVQAIHIEKLRLQIAEVKQTAP